MHELGDFKPPQVPKSAPRVRLHVVSGPGAGQIVQLNRCVCLAGTRPGCKLLLRSPHVSPVHFAIVNTGEEIYLRDLVSHTGTHLNELKAVEEKLEDGDTIQIADWEFRVEIVAYMVDTLSDLPHVSLEPSPTTFGVEVNGAGSLLKLKRTVNLVGRRDGCDVILRSQQVSRAHLLLFTYLGQPAFCDLLSNNGVRLEGERTGFSFLHSGDCLEMGGLSIRLILPGITRRRPDMAVDSGGSGSSGGRRLGDTPVHQSNNGSGTAMDGSSSGTAIVFGPVDEGDRVDIRAAEENPTRKR